MLEVLDDRAADSAPMVLASSPDDGLHVVARGEKI
jgi:hypothetical protein